MPLIIAICGYHNSGKTTFGTYLVKRLKNLGYKIAVVKSTKEEGELTDQPGSDTFRYRESGGDPVCLYQKNLLTLYIKELPDDKGSFLQFLERLFWKKDLILFEGFKGFPEIPKIWVLRDDEKEEEIKSKYSGIELFIRQGEEEKGLNFVLQRLINKEEEVFLYINGKRIFLKPFIQKILKEMLLGFVKGLKDIPESIFHLEVKIKRK
ncbi:MAG: molybdopterin-guanine dinucleotide biosynthesis protein MobB [Caldimicrobium sp.]